MSLLLLFVIFFFFNDTATTEIYTLSLHDALPIYLPAGQHAVADGRVPGADPHHLHWHDPAAEECENAAHRPHERPLSRPPPHRLRKRERPDDARDRLRDHVGGRAAGNGAPHGHGLAARGVDDDEIRDLDLLGACEPLRGARGLAVRSEPGGGRRPEDLRLPVVLTVRNPASEHDEPARRRERPDRLGREPLLRKRLRDAAGEIFPRAAEHRRGGLLRPDLEEKVVAFQVGFRARYAFAKRPPESTRRPPARARRAAPGSRRGSPRTPARRRTRGRARGG